MMAEQIPSLLKNEIELFVKNTRFVPGSTVAAAMPDGRVVRASAGVSDIEAKIPMTDSDRMLAGSVGKTFVAATIATLVSRGKLSYSDCAISYLPSEPWVSAVANVRQATVGQLLSHTSGIPDYSDSETLWSLARDRPDRTWRREEPLTFLAGVPPLFEPGTGFKYSDSNFALLGMVAERAAGEEYYGMVRREVWQPFGLADTEASDRRDMRGLTAAYSGLDMAPFRMPRKISEPGMYGFDPCWDWTAGGIVSTSADLAKWCRALYGAEARPEWRQMRVPSPQSVGKREIPNNGSYGLGTMIWETPEFGVCFGHSGWMVGFNTIAIYFPSVDIAIACQNNYDRVTRSRPLDVALRFLRVVLPK